MVYLRPFSKRNVSSLPTVTIDACTPNPTQSNGATLNKFGPKVYWPIWSPSDPLGGKAHLKKDL